MPRILISYRREDTAAYAGRLYDGLVERYGEKQVFMDISALQPGVDFVAEIERAVATSDAMLVIIGRRWLTAADAQGRRRIEKPEDFVGLEVGSALTRGIRLIPVLVDGASMPTSEDLPESLKPLAQHNAIEFSDARWRYDLSRLLGALDSDTRGAAESVEVRQSTRNRWAERIGPTRSSGAYIFAAWFVGACLAEALHSERIPLPFQDTYDISKIWLVCGLGAGFATAMNVGVNGMRLWLLAVGAALATAATEAIAYEFVGYVESTDLSLAISSGAWFGAALCGTLGALIATIGNTLNTSRRSIFVLTAAIGSALGLCLQWQTGWDAPVWMAGVAALAVWQVLMPPSREGPAAAITAPTT